MTTMPYPHLGSRLRDKWWGEGRAEGLAEGLAEGRAEAAADAVLRVLFSRGLAVPAAVTRRVRELTDRIELEVLLTRAVAVDRAEDLFADQPFD